MSIREIRIILGRIVNQVINLDKSIGNINLEAFGLDDRSLQSPEKYIPEFIEVAKQLVELKGFYYKMDDTLEDIKKLEDYFNREISTKKKEKLYDIINKSESETLEFKINLRDPRLIIKNLTSMANTKGGLLVIGINESKKDINEKIVGIQNPEKIIKSIKKLVNDIYPPISFISEIIEIKDKKVLIIEIKHMDKYVHLINGIGYHRIGDRDIAFTPEQIKNRIISKTELSVERFTEQIEVLTQTIDKLKSPNYGTIEYLEGSIVLNIYDFILKNPTVWKKDTRGISPQRKKHVKVRDKFRCQFCGELFKEEELVVDHIFPHSVGGSNEEYNLMALCTRCNDDKSASLKYYRSEEGRYKICDNIKEFVRTLPIIDDFGKWLKNFGDARRRKKKT